MVGTSVKKSDPASNLFRGRASLRHTDHEQFWRTAPATDATLSDLSGTLDP